MVHLAHQQRNEAHQVQYLGRELLAMANNQAQFLVVFDPDRNHQPAPVRQLRQQFLGNLLRRSRGENGSEWSFFLPTPTNVSVFELHIPQPK